MSREEVHVAMENLRNVLVRYSILHQHVGDNTEHELRWRQAIDLAKAEFHRVIKQDIGLVVLMRLRWEFTSWQLDLLRNYGPESSD